MSTENMTEYDKAFADRFWLLWVVNSVPWGFVCLFWLGPGGVGEGLRDYWNPIGLTDYALLGLLLAVIWLVSTVGMGFVAYVAAETVLGSLHISAMQQEAEEFFAEEHGLDGKTHQKELGSLYGKCGCYVSAFGSATRFGETRSAYLCRRHAYGPLHSTMKHLLKDQRHNINWDSD